MFFDYVLQIIPKAKQFMFKILLRFHWLLPFPSTTLPCRRYSLFTHDPKPKYPSYQVVSSNSSNSFESIRAAQKISWYFSGLSIHYCCY